MRHDHPSRPDVWVHPSIAVRPSPIAGDGLFATDDLDADVVVVRLGGWLVGTAELHRLLAEAEGGGYVDTMAVGIDTHLILPPGTAAHYGNHRCEPTMWPVGPYELATRVPVPAAAELTLDYGLISDDPTFRMDCTCGAATCRSTVTGEDWRDPELQVRYAGHWRPGLQHRIDALATPPE